MTRWIAPFACTAALLTAAAAPTPGLFDVEQAQGWAEALAVCDVTRFLVTRPDLDADVILATDESTGWMRPLYGPRFMPPNLFYDGEVKRAFHRLERAGELERNAFVEARARVDRPMMRRFRQQRASDRRFLEMQSDVCDALEAQVQSRYP